MTYPVFMQLEDLGEEEQQKVTPGLTVVVGLQGQEVFEGITANAGEKRDVLIYFCFMAFIAPSIKPLPCSLSYCIIFQRNIHYFSVKLF